MLNPETVVTFKKPPILNLQLYFGRTVRLFFEKKLNFILRSSHDSDSPRVIGLNQTKNGNFYRNFIIRAFFTFSILGIAIPRETHAGFFSFVGDIFGSDKKIEEVKGNSQNIPLLAPAGLPDTDPKKGEITIVENEALSSESGPLGTAADIEDAPVTDTISVYVVRKGDTISSVAKMFDVSANTILWANNLKKGQALTDGQTLVILPISGIKHEVKKGDTLKKIAEKYKGDVEDVAQFNGLSVDEALELGSEIIVPDGEMVAVANPTKSSGKKTSTSKKEKTWGTTDPLQAGYYIHPVPSSRKSQGLHGFNGIDFAAPIGTPIRAAASGTVIVDRRGGWGGGYGTYLVISHSNGTQTLYAHNTRNVVSQGESVEKGQIIGYVGSTGRSTGPHLHFEIRGAKNPF